MVIKLIDISDQYDHEGVETLLYDIFVPEMRRTVGRIEYRKEHGRDLMFYGNIGYVIYPPYRGKRLAYYACLALVEILKQKRIGMPGVLITCNPDNYASKKTIQNLGAKYITTVNVDVDHELYSQGDVQKEIYELCLES